MIIMIDLEFFTNEHYINVLINNRFDLNLIFKVELKNIF